VKKEQVFTGVVDFDGRAVGYFFQEPEKVDFKVFCVEE
jgi:hypothetical protein